MLKRFCIYLLLGIGIVLSISNSTYGETVPNCNVTSSENTTNTKWKCITGNTFTLSATYTASKAGVVVTSEANTASTVIINNYGTIRATDSDEAAIKVGGSDSNVINNYAGATIRGGEKAIRVDSATDLTIDNAGTVTSDGKQAIYSTGTNTDITNSGIIEATTFSAIQVQGSNASINNSGTILVSASGTNNAVNSSGDNLILINTGTGTVQAPNYSVNVTGDNATITNSGIIFGTTQRAIYINSTGHTITNESDGTIKAGESGWDATGGSDRLAVELGANATNLILENYHR